jgi:hypothetical protein
MSKRSKSKSKMNTKILTVSIIFLMFCLGAYSQAPVILTVNQPAPLVANAGADVQINKGESVILGGTPSAAQGYGNYVYSWSPSAGLDDATLPNPTAKPDITTTYQLTVIDVNRCSAVSEVNVSVNTSGINLKSGELSVRCFPNPVLGNLHVGIQGMPMSVTIRLANPMGQEIFRKVSMMEGNDLEEDIPMTELPSGVYYVQIITGQATYCQSIIKTLLP